MASQNYRVEPRADGWSFNSGHAIQPVFANEADAVRAATAEAEANHQEGDDTRVMVMSSGRRFKLVWHLDDRP